MTSSRMSYIPHKVRASSTHTRVLKRALVVATVAWGLLLTAHILLADHWWPWTIVEIAPPLFWAVVPTATLGWAIVIRPVSLSVIFAQGLYLTAGLGLANLVPTPPAADPFPGDIKVLQWNTEFWGQQGRTTQQLGESLQEADADILVLQEHGRPDGQGGITSLFSTSDLEQWFPNFHIALAHDMVTISRYPVVDVRVDPSQGAMVTEHRTPNGTIEIVNVHTVAPFDLEQPLWSAEFWSNLHKREVLQNQQLDWVVQQTTAPGSIIVVGDLNTTGTVRPMLDRFSTMSDISDQPWRGTWGPGPLDLWRLDWQLASDGLCSSGYQIGEPTDVSDHRPVTFYVSASHAGEGPC